MKIQEVVKSKNVLFDLITCHDEAAMRLRALLEGIYNTSISGNDERTNAETITVLCSLAQVEVKVMDDVFVKLTQENGGKK